MKTPSFFTSQEVAQLLETSRTTVQRWIDSGDLKAFKTPGNHRRVTPEDLSDFLRKQGMPVPRNLRQKVRILVIDDEGTYGRALKTMLERGDQRFEVEVALDGLAGLLSVGTSHPDIVLLDAMMPGWDGFEVCRRLKRAPETKDILVVGISGTSANEKPFRKAGADAFLHKPFDVVVLVALVAWLGVRTGGSPPLKRLKSPKTRDVPFGTFVTKGSPVR